MREELKQCNSVGSKEGFLFFLDSILEKHSISFDAINSICSGISSSELNARAGLFLLEDLGYIEVLDSSERLTSAGSELAGISSRCHRIECLIVRIIENLTAQNRINIKGLSFNHTEKSIIIRRWAIPLQYAVYRNLLVSLGGLIPDSNGWKVDNKYENIFVQSMKDSRQKITQEELMEKLKKQQEDGERAEEFVLEYEKARLKKTSLIPKRISLIDVAAGYDIVSYTSELSESYDRFIEVKAYRGNPHFYWSQNERLVAEAYKDRYFIYLVDVTEVDEQKSQYKPIIVNDPCKTLSEEGWLTEPNSFKVTQLL